MKSIIEELRNLCGKQGEVWDENYEMIDAALDEYMSGKDGYTTYEVEKVDEDFEDGGRWTNYRIDVYKITENDGTVAYFSLWREVPATEMQEGGDFSYSLAEAEPKEVTVIQYVNKR